MFTFHEGDAVILKKDQGNLLRAGSRGVVICQYATQPPSYEVNFMDSDGKEFGAILDERDLAADVYAVPPAASVAELAASA